MWILVELLPDWTNACPLPLFGYGEEWEELGLCASYFAAGFVLAVAEAVSSVCQFNGIVHGCHQEELQAGGTLEGATPI